MALPLPQNQFRELGRRPTQRPRVTEEQVKELEQRFPQGFTFKTQEGEFQFTPGVTEGFQGRISPAFQRVPTRQFTPKPAKVPIIISSERAREKFQKNLERLQNFERQFQNVGSTQVLPPIEPPKPKPNLRGTI